MSSIILFTPKFGFEGEVEGKEWEGGDIKCPIKDLEKDSIERLLATSPAGPPPTPSATANTAIF
jgi:hypothetical protein